MKKKTIRDNELNKLTTQELINYIQSRDDIKICGYLEDKELTREGMKEDNFTQEAIDYYLDMSLSYLVEGKTWEELLEDADFEGETGCKIYNDED
jgi:hypothetical protein